MHIEIYMIRRVLDFDRSGPHSIFLWGPRQTGKSTLLRERFSDAPYYDLHRASEFRRLAADPGLLREECLAIGPGPRPIIIDEIQKLPELLDEVHSLISRDGFRFILCGSSARHQYLVQTLARSEMVETAARPLERRAQALSCRSEYGGG